MKPRVVVSLLTSAQEFQLLQAADARSAAQRVGVDLEVVFAENNAVVQIHQIYKFVHAPEGERPFGERTPRSQWRRWRWTSRRSDASRPDSSRRSFPRGA